MRVESRMYDLIIEKYHNIYTKLFYTHPLSLISDIYVHWVEVAENQMLTVQVGHCLTDLLVQNKTLLQVRLLLYHIRQQVLVVGCNVHGKL